MKNYLNSLIIGISIVMVSLVLAYTYKTRNSSQNSIVVTGLGEKNFESDLIVWSGSFSRKSMDLKEAYAALDQDREEIKKYLVSKGLQDNDLVFSAVSIEKEYNEEYDAKTSKSNSVFTGYRLNQSVQIESGAVDRVEEVSRQVTELINIGLEFYSQKPQYYYTKLAELKIEMIAEATKDGFMRASKIAENAGCEVGTLKNANMGVFQIVAQNSSEEYSWGGSFNTYSKKKTARITMKLEYGVK